MSTDKVVSSWSLHRTLGRFTAGDLRATRGASGERPADRFVARIEPSAAADGALELLALPAELRRRGFDGVQLVHFHLPSRAPEYLAALRTALEENDVRLDTFLVDDGDLTHPSDPEANEDWISEWLTDAEALGATRARVIAGRSAPSAETISQSAAGLRRLAAGHPQLRIVIENWHELTPDARSVNEILDAAGDELGLLVDLANWTGPTTCDELAAVAGRAETCHAKCHVGDVGFAEESTGVRDYLDALRAIRGAGFSGSLALVYDGADPDEWSMLDRQHKVTGTVFG